MIYDPPWSPRSAPDPLVTLIREGDGVHVHVQLDLAADNP